MVRVRKSVSRQRTVNKSVSMPFIFIPIFPLTKNEFEATQKNIAGEGNGNPLQYSCLENPMDRGAWSAAVHEVAKSWTRLSDSTFTFHFPALEKEMATHSSYSCLENPRDGGAWWAAVYGVTQSRTQLKQLSSSRRRIQLISIFCWNQFSSVQSFSHVQLLVNPWTTACQTSLSITNS